MNKKFLGLKSKNEIPLLEQERIKELYVSNEISRKSNLTLFAKGIITAISTLLVIGTILFVFWINGFEDKNLLGQATTIETQTEYVTKDSEFTTDTDLDVDPPSDTNGENTGEIPTINMTLDKLYSFDPSQVSDGEVGIIPMDLSQKENGVLYINNTTGYKPNLEALIEKSLKNYDYEFLSNKDSPRVLILHTHASDSYVYEGELSYKFESEIDFARSDEQNENVILLGRIISTILNENGINTIHCTTLHDSIRYKDSYSRSEATIKQYLEIYPTIELVIDLDRDALISSGGDIIRPVTLVNNKPTAQILCVVGSDWAGDSYNNWQDNLSLALKFREQLNLKYSNLCRPIELLPYTYNQELSKYAITIKIGSCGNSLEEAQESAKIVAENLVEILKTIPF